jgi:hypothetical protein
MKDPEQDLLLNEILACEDLENLRRASLKQGLTVVRRKRRARKAALACLVGFAVIAPVMLLVYKRPVRSAVTGNRPGTTVAQLAVPPLQHQPIERIGDEELLALFPNQSVALLGAPGHRRLLVFASSPPQSSSSQ